MDRSHFKEICQLIGITCLFSTNISWGEAAKSSCSAAPNLQQIYLQHKADPPKDDKTHISANKTSGTREKMVLTGRVRVKSPTQTLHADQVVYDQKAGRVDATGNVVVINKDTVIKGASGYKILNKDQAEIKNAKFWSASRNFRGQAKQVNIDNIWQTRLKKVQYSTCPKKRQVWVLSAKELLLDRNKGRGVAKNVVVKIGPVPILYLPRLSFPIDNRRKSGFLMPSFGHSDNSGADISVPYYWNIAPNRDLTFNPRHLSKRGFQLGGEYRYLKTNSKGTVGFQILPDDDIYNDDRHLFYYKQQGKLGRYWSTNIDLNTVSDPDYFLDLGKSLATNSATQLERRIDLLYTRPHWSLLTRFQNYQPLRGVAESYQRLPQILLRTNIPSNNDRLTWHLNAEAVQFDHDLNVVTGTRLDITPGVTLKLLNHPGYFLTSKLSARYTQYKLENTTGETNLDRNLPIFSLDGGLYFDRYFSWRSKPYLQTLEPRIYYLNVPHKDQSALPIFDTSLLDFDVNQLFRENRFSGADRQGDANQITLALTTRFIKESTGKEKFRATLGQIYYFDDRLVTLPGGSTQIGTNSDAVAEFSWRPTAYQLLKTSVQWDPEATRSKVTLFGYQYKADSRHLLNIAYRFRENSIEQTDFSTRWRLSNRWNFVGRWNYSIKDNTTLEGIAGLEYSSCCWALRLVGRTYIKDISAERENSVQLQIVLKGLSRLGDNIGTLLKQSITGYEDKF